MSNLNEQLLDIITKNKLQNYLANCNFGLEKENVRVDKYGSMVKTPHPKAFGNRLTNPYVKTDFSESQIEMATPVCHTVNSLYDSLETIHDMVSTTLKDEYLWPSSNPPRLPSEDEIPIANMGDKFEEEFRINLSKRYGSKKQMISGIHYNFSFDDEFLKILYGKLAQSESYREFKDKIYLKICRNFLKYRWLLIYLTGASPVFHRTFIENYVKAGERLDDESCFFPYMISLRNSKYGYKNIENFYVSFDSVNEYVSNINAIADKGKIQDICEFYGPVRLKTGNDDELSHELIEDGIKYIEFRIFDLNPLCKIGISKDTLYFTHLFVLYMLLKNGSSLDKNEGEIADMNAEISSSFGMQKKLYLYEDNKEKTEFRKKAVNILDDISHMLTLLNMDSEYFMNLIKNEKDKVINPYNTFAAEIIRKIREKSFITFHMEMAEEYLKDSKYRE